MQKPTLLVIGAGQLGSRHLQALSSLPQRCNIITIDPSNDALKTCADRVREIEGWEQHSYKYQQHIDNLPIIDVAVIATTANSRRQVVERLLSITNVRNLILEKVLFQSAQDCIEIEEKLKSRNVSTWVNAPRPMWTCYKHLKKAIGEEPIQRFIAGGNGWGLACNTYHMLDLFVWLTNSKISRLSSDYIDKQPIPSKRSGFFELTGNLNGCLENGTIFSISDIAGPPKDRYLLLETADRLININEVTQEITLVSGSPLPSNLAEIEFTPEFQSTLTNKVVKDILERGDCELTPYTEASRIHQYMLSEYAKCFPQKQQGDLLCPIT